MSKNKIKTNFNKLIDNLFETAVKEYHKTEEYNLILEKREQIYSMYGGLLCEEEYMLTRVYLLELTETYSAEIKHLFRKALSYGISLSY